jgi:hypothetical protein
MVECLAFLVFRTEIVAVVEERGEELRYRAKKILYRQS